MSLYITTPIFYVNAQPHLGHAYTAIVADTFARFKRLSGEEVFFQTGTDEHGDKIVQAARDAGEASPRAYADRISAAFRDAWPPLAVQADRFIRTTEAEHIRTVQAILQKVHDLGDIYFSSYTGLYCKGCERFLTEKEISNGLCPDHLTAPESVSEANYFFRMSRYQDWLRGHIEANPDFITPERYRNEVLAFLREPLEDLCISRPTSRLSWGIPLPFDANFVTYVWFDALINYLTGIGYPEGEGFARRWAAAEHLIAKDILKPHAIYWPTMLRSLGLPPPRRIRVHGYWNINETKMSKSLGNIVRPAELTALYGADTVRYFLLREMSFGLDASFSQEALLARQNSDLANDLGNLASRCFMMVKKFAGARVPAPGTMQTGDQELADAAIAMIAQYVAAMDAFAPAKALQAIWEVIGRANRYIVVNAPWDLAKDPDQEERLRTVLYTLLETLRLITLTLHPIMPATAAAMDRALGIGTAPDLRRDSCWGLLRPEVPAELAGPLFPRLDKAEVEKKALAVPAPSLAPAALPPSGRLAGTPMAETPPPAANDGQALLTIDYFKAVDLRVAEIKEAQRVPKSTKLLKLTVLAPEERTVVAGIGEHFQPEELIGRKVVIVANLQPAKLMGIQSHGMVLAARDGGRLTLLTPADSVAAGCKIS